MKILVCLPFFQGDAHRATEALDWMADLSGQQERTIILAHEDSVDATDVQVAASRAFRTVEHLRVTACANGWPISANCYFADIAFAMRGRDSWLLMESDCTSLHADTLDRLEFDYGRAGKPNVGPIIPAYLKKGEVWVEQGKMLAGVAIYHPKLWDNSALLQSLKRVQAAYAKQKAHPKAFDCYLANDVLPHAADTPLIQHMGRSTNFREEAGKIRCDYPPAARWDPIIGPHATLVHGCKDGSLIALLREKAGIPAAQFHPPVSATIIPAAVPRPARPSAGIVWQDENPKPEKGAPVAPSPAPAAPQAAPVRPPVPRTTDHEAFATLADVRKSLSHWPDCKAVALSIQARNDRYRIVCQCGASSPKLPEGHDWEAVWKEWAAQAPPVANAGVNGLKEEAPITPSREEIKKTFERLAEMPADGSGPPTHEFETSPWIGLVEESDPDPIEWEFGIPASQVDIMGIHAQRKHVPAIFWRCYLQVFWERAPVTFARYEAEYMKPARVKNNAPREAVPLSKIRFKQDAMARFPEWDWKNLTTPQWQRKLKQAKKRERDQTAKDLAKKMNVKTERLLTAEARARKLELAEMTRGKKGAFLDLRHLADEMGVAGTKHLKKDQLIIAILEKEFENPYLEAA